MGIYQKAHLGKGVHHKAVLATHGGGGFRRLRYHLNL